MQVERTTGDVTFNDCDAGELTVTTSTGDVEGSFFTKKYLLQKQAQEG